MAIKYRLADKEKERADEVINKLDEIYSNPISTEKTNNVKTTNKTNVGTDIQGFGDTFGRSLGNLGINAFQNMQRIKPVYSTIDLDSQTNEILARQGYSDEQIKNRPTLKNMLGDSADEVLLKDINEPINNKFQEWEDVNNEKIQENIQNASNSVSKKILELTPSMAQSSAHFIPGGTLIFAAGVTQNYYEQGKEQRGLSDEEANKYAAIMGSLEYATESVGAFLTKRIGTAVFKEGAIEGLKALGLDVGENFIEEAVMVPLEELTVSGVAGPDKANWDNILQRSLSEGFDGGLTATLMGGTSAGIGKAASVTNKITKGQTVTQTELQEAVRAVQESGKVDIQKAIKESISAAVEKNIQNLQQNQANSQVNTQEQQTISQKNKIAQNQNTEKIENLKQQQLDIITNTNPMSDDYHTGIRSVDDIKTFNEVINDDESFVYGDFSKQDAENALKEGKITVYSSNPIEQGSFVSTSKNMAKDYAGNGQIYSQEVNLNDVAWINGDEGQYAKVENVANNKQSEIPRLEDRIQGDDLLNAQDLINDIKEVGAEIDDKGYVTLYHRTTPENAKQILETGKMSAKEDGLFFSTNANGKNNSNYGEAIVKLKVPAEMLELNDVFNDEASIRIPLKNRNEILDVSKYIANNQETLYNDNESESDLNGRYTQGNDTTSGIYEESTQKQRQFTWDEYNKWEQSIKPISEESITNEERESIGKSKKEHNKEVYLFDENNNDNTYSGGPSQTNPNRINISKQQADYFGLDFMIDHETIESDILQNEELFHEIIEPVLEKIKEDNNFANQADEFWKNETEEKPSDNLIAKDIFCDRFAQRRGGELKYNNILSQETNMNIDYALDSFYKEIYGKDIENSNKSSFVLPKADKTIQDVRLPKAENANQTTENEKIAEILNTPIQQQKPQQRIWAIMKANLVDKGAVFEDISKRINNRELEAKWDSTLLSGAKGQYAIGNDRYVFENGEKTRVSKSLESIIEEVGDKENEFQNYMYHQLNIDRMTLDERFGIENKPVFGDSIDANYSKEQVQKYEKSNPEFKEYAQDVYDFLNANKQELVRSGVISQELSDILAERYPHYVPIRRVGVNGNAIAVPLDTRRTGVNAPLKKAKGGSQDIQPLFNTIADRTLQTYRASARNSFGVELKNSLDQLNILNQTSENIDVDNILDTVSDEDANNELLKKAEKGKNPTFTVFENGNKVTYDINEDMYDALKPKNELLSKFDNSKLSKGIQKFGNFRRGLLTEYNPVFSLTNAIKDAQDVLINSQHATKTYMKLPEAYAQILGNGYYFQEYIQNGGEQNSYFKDGDFAIKKKTTVPNKIMDKVTIPLKAISKVNNVIEMSPRLAEYITSREEGRSIQTSMLDASRVTTNFKAGGDITKFANRNGVTFLNASVQGLAQNVRNIREAHQKGLKGYAVLAGKMAVAGLPALILNNLIWADDDDYEDLQDYVKDNYYIIGKYGDGQFIRIPKGRTVGVIQKIVTNIDEFINNKNNLDIDEYATQFWKDLKEDVDLAASNLAPNNPIENNILSPIFQAISNKTWYGGDLVPTRLQDKPAEEQYDETTDSLSKWIGSKTGLSPMKINYLLDQYSGGAGDVMLPMLTPQAENNALEDKFTTNSVMKSRYPGEFFEKFDELNIKNNSEKATDEDKLKYKYFSNVRSEVSKLYNKKREIQNSSDTDKVKKEQLLEVQKQINKYSEDALNNLKETKVSGNTAAIGNEEYYKSKGVWTNLTDQDRIDGVGLKDYANYKNSIEGLTKDSEKINALSRLNMSSKTKASIYENTIGKDDNTYSIMKNTGIDINAYLKYKSNIGSTKDSVLSYLNTANDISYEQQLLLLGLKYSLSNEEKRNLANYVNSLDISKNDKLDIFGKLKGFTVYKNGTVKW